MGKTRFVDEASLPGGLAGAYKYPEVSIYKASGLSGHSELEADIGVSAPVEAWGTSGGALQVEVKGLTPEMLKAMQPGTYKWAEL
ncbi:MAG: hypothetical protein JW778_04675 [Candidatus Altiarchaeota archaeon]|nr:hypothetical protein [Candidatus Altiarchaeota archaeon]